MIKILLAKVSIGIEIIRISWFRILSSFFHILIELERRKFLWLSFEHEHDCLWAPSGAEFEWIYEVKIVVRCHISMSHICLVIKMTPLKVTVTSTGCSVAITRFNFDYIVGKLTWIMNKTNFYKLQYQRMQMKYQLYNMKSAHLCTQSFEYF